MMHFDFVIYYLLALGSDWSFLVSIQQILKYQYRILCLVCLGDHQVADLLEGVEFCHPLFDHLPLLILLEEVVMDEHNLGEGGERSKTSRRQRLLNLFELFVG